MKKQVIFFLFALLCAGTVAAQDTTGTHKSADKVITGERTRNPGTKPNPHPAGIVTGERTRNPEASKNNKPSRQQPAVTEEKSGKPQD